MYYVIEWDFMELANPKYNFIVWRAKYVEMQYISKTSFQNIVYSYVLM